MHPKLYSETIFFHRCWSLKRCIKCFFNLSLSLVLCLVGYGNDHIMLERTNFNKLELDCKAWFPFGHFLPFIDRFGFSCQQKTKTSNAMLKWKHLQYTKTRNQRHFPVLVFEIELILSQKQERATKSSKKRRTATRPKNQNEQQKATKSTFHSHFHSLLQLWTNERWLISRTMENQREQQRATTSSKNLRRAIRSKTLHRS